MERRLPLIICFILLNVSSFLFAQNLNQNNKVQILLWAEKDAYPGVVWNENETPDFFAENDNPYALPVSRLKVIAPFFVEGMVYGWRYEYTPSDKERGVKEYMEFEPVQELTEYEKKLIEFKNAAFKDDRLYCRIEFPRSDSQKNLLKSWESVTNPKIRGSGYGRLEDGYEGIRQACSEAIKNAVREYWRSRIKNKPREISGRILLSTPPAIGVDAGRYRVTLDFFMETDRILKYKMF